MPTIGFSLSLTGEGNGNPLQCSCLENPRDEGAWWADVYGVAQSRTRLKRLSSSIGPADLSLLSHHSNKLRQHLLNCKVHSVVSDSLRPHELPHARPPCPSPTPRVYSNSCPSSQRCHPAISSSVSLPPIPPSFRVFSNDSALHMRWPKYWSFSFSISPSSEHPGLISLRNECSVACFPLLKFWFTNSLRAKNRPK